MREKLVRAAGGVVYRPREDGSIEVAVIHRPKYDDWTLPKGKLERGETEEEGALREVEEETGIRATIERKLGETRYRDRGGRPKKVTYYAMRANDGAFRRNWEVDELRWVTPDEAARLLDHDHDRRLVTQLSETPPI